jgi:hypothetical protein
MLKRALAGAALAIMVAAPGAADAAAAPLHYGGRTKEGTKISFVLDRGWIDQLKTLLPTTCISVQGGTPQVDLILWRIPYKFRLGTTAKVDYGDPTVHYGLMSRQRGARISGKLSMNYSLLGSDNAGGYKVWHCLATASFDLRPR